MIVVVLLVVQETNKVLKVKKKKNTCKHAKGHAKPSFSSAVDKARNMEHPGTSRYIPEHRIIMIIMKIKLELARVTIWSAQIGRVT